MDVAQAERMLALLRQAAGGSVSSEGVKAVLAEPGTGLIIEQMNISREVTRDQYRAVLLHLAEPDPPELTPASSSERGRRGMDGLLKNVWPSLRWGLAQIDLLSQRLTELRKMDLAAAAQSLAVRFLPEPVEMTPRLFIVMGGRAGAAALSGDRIYFDVLISSYYAETGTLANYPPPPYVGEFFAHEMHHLGLSRIIERNRAGLSFNEPEKLAFDFLSALVLEGSATYLINAHRSEDFRRDPQFASYFARESGLFTTCQDVLRGILDAGLSGEAYEKAITPLAGSGWHALGGVMLAAIDRAGGLEAVFDVLRDPRQLLLAYGRAIKGVSSGGFPFAAEVADDSRLAELFGREEGRRGNLAQRGSVGRHSKKGNSYLLASWPPSSPYFHMITLPQAARTGSVIATSSH